MKKYIAATSFLLIVILHFVGPAHAEGFLRIVTQETTINREPGGAGTDNRLTRNAIVSWIGDAKSGWYHVRLRNGEDGWIPDWTAEPAPPDSQLSDAFPPDMLPTTAGPLYGVVVSDNVSWRSTPYGGLSAKLDTTRGGFLPRGCTLKLTDKIFHWFQAQISATDYVWVYDETLSPVEKPDNVSTYGVPLVEFTNYNDDINPVGLVFYFRFRAPVPYALKSNLDPPEAVLKLFGVKCEGRMQPPCAQGGGVCSCSPENGSFEVSVPAPRGRMAGVSGKFDGNLFVLNIRDTSIAPIKRIMIDPGHGAEDPAPKGFADGTHSANGLKEKDAVLQISKTLADALQAAGFETILSREGNTNKTLDIYRRVELSDTADSDLYISVHANGDENTKMQGPEIYWYEQQSRPLAELILKEISAATGRKPGGVFYASFGVMRQTRIPAVLVETGYMTNAEEGARYSNPEFLKLCADGIARGVERYVEYINGSK
jgi:N-acetylmuramoyl-L-alanine amidase